MHTPIHLLLVGFITLFRLSHVTGTPDNDIELNSFKVLTEYDTSWIDWDTIRLKKVSRTELAITGDINIKRNLGNEQRIAVQIFEYNSETNRRGPLVYQVEKPLCEMAKQYKSTYDGMVEFSNLPANFECPLPKDVYTFKDYILQTDFLPKATPAGDYEVVLTIKDAEKGVSGLAGLVTVN